MKPLRTTIILLLICNIFALSAKATENKGRLLPGKVENGDTIYYAYLNDIYVFPTFKFKNKAQEKFYWKTVRDVKKALPYARLASQVMQETDHNLAKIKNTREREKYIKEREKILFNQFEKDLKKLTVSQGKMLVKLIDRECNKTTYEIIKNYKGNFSAFLWQGVAKIFGSNLKAEYDGSDKDKIIERVIILVEAGQL
jgi:hypothetical protein